MLSAGIFGKDLHSRRLWSLWDMINFRFVSAYMLLRELTVLIQVSNENMQRVDALGGYDSPAVRNDPTQTTVMGDCKKEAATLATAAQNLFAALSVHIDSAAKALERWAKGDNHRWAELNTRSRGLRDAVFTELKDYYYYQYPKEKYLLLADWETDWKELLAAFPEIRRDAFCAVDCYALQHHTASVFHSMRVLEQGLGALASHVGLNFDLQQWNTIIEQIEVKITELRKTLPRGVEKNERMQFLSRQQRNSSISRTVGAITWRMAAGITMSTKRGAS